MDDDQGLNSDTMVLDRLPGRHRAVFVDGSGRRKRVLTWVVAVAALGALVYTVALVASMLGGVETESALPRPAATRPAATRPAASAVPPSSPVRSQPTRKAAVVREAPARKTETRRAPAPAPSSSSPSPTPTASSSPTPDDFWSRLFPTPPTR